MGIVFLSIFFSFCCAQLPANNVNNKNNKNNGQHLNNVMNVIINNKLTLGPKVNVNNSRVKQRAGARRETCGRSLRSARGLWPGSVSALSRPACRRKSLAAGRRDVRVVILIRLVIGVLSSTDRVTIVRLPHRTRHTEVADERETGNTESSYTFYVPCRRGSWFDPGPTSVCVSKARMKAATPVDVSTAHVYKYALASS